MVNKYFQMEIPIEEIIKTIDLMGLVLIIGMMVLAMKEASKMD